MCKIQSIILSVLTFTPQQLWAATAGIPVVVISYEAPHLDPLTMGLSALLGTFLIRRAQSKKEAFSIYIFCIVLGGVVAPDVADAVREAITHNTGVSENLRLAFSAILSAWSVIINWLTSKAFALMRIYKNG